jgi:hypothetical protein
VRKAAGGGTEERDDLIRYGTSDVGMSERHERPWGWSKKCCSTQAPSNCMRQYAVHDLITVSTTRKRSSSSCSPFPVMLTSLVLDLLYNSSSRCCSSCSLVSYISHTYFVCESSPVFPKSTLTIQQCRSLSHFPIKCHVQLRASIVRRAVNQGVLV